MRVDFKLRRIRQAVCVALLAMPGWYGVNDAVADEVATRYKIQAGFLLHLTSYTYWPAPSDKRQICVGRGHRFGTFLHDLAAIKQVNDNKERLVVKTVAVADDLTSCDVFYAPQQLQDQFSVLLSKVRAGTLTISDSSDFISAGGAMEFYMSGQSVRMRVHRGNLLQDGLTLSASLLQLLDLVDQPQSYQELTAGG